MGKFFSKAIFYEQWSRLWAFIIAIVFIIGIKPINFLGSVKTIESIKSFDEIPAMMSLGINLDLADYFLLIVMLITLVAMSTGSNKQKSLSFLNSKNVTRKQILGTQFIAVLTISMIAIIISTIVRVIVYFSVKEVFNEYLNIYISDIVIYFFTVSIVTINVLSVTFLYQAIFGKTIISVLAIPATLGYLIIGPIILWRINYHFRFIDALGNSIEKVLFKLYDVATQQYLRGGDYLVNGTCSKRDSISWMVIVFIITVILIFIMFLLNQYYEVQNLGNIFVFSKVKVATNLLITIMSASFISIILYAIYSKIHAEATGEALRIMLAQDSFSPGLVKSSENLVRHICNIISFVVSPFIYMLLNKIVNVIDGVEGKKIRKIKI
ncbi:hypothetical protein [Clostridium cellulovorans]|uniref:Uncharacterized protein n=1 Tax=Clostridium cellulovorans (strain ATCC 35296 / DSM 3052 / OCM 3 / 743B) TaxID=573061 RepID=D9SMR1_CLOC7|nr:hypothetical protein [Clostridium cellulovorans]ADL49846.1 hypothetical protein Clocel_0057 [Clostridium cellulovorans 743B]